MRRGLFCLWTMLLVIGSSTVAQAGWFDGVKAGGTILYNDSSRGRFNTSGVGIHLSADIRPPGEFIVTPFYEVAAGKPSIQMMGGVLSWAVSMRDRRTHTFYFGGTYGVLMSDGVSVAMYGLHVGYKFPLNERTGVFIQVKGIESKENVFQGIVASVGLTFALWGESAEED